MCTIEDLIEYRRQREKLIQREIALKLPTDFGEFDLFAYTSMVDHEPHLALSLGGVGVEAAPGVVPVQTEPVLVRMHSECLTGDVLALGQVRLRPAAAPRDGAGRRGRPRRGRCTCGRRAAASAC